MLLSLQLSYVIACKIKEFSHNFVKSSKGNSEKGDVVFDTIRQNTTGHRTTAKKKRGALPHYLRTLIPYLLLLVLKTKGLNDSDERKYFIVPKTINLHKLKLTQKIKTGSCTQTTE
jgi:hypothetical protein